MREEATTPDLAELVRRSLEAANHRDFDVAQSLFAPDAVWEVVSLGTSFEGVAAIRGFVEDWLGLTRSMRSSRSRFLTSATEWCLP
jgi:ketosteroid isomerase-like protein